MKSIVFDTGPFISLTLNNLIWIIEPLQKKFDGEFVITPGVYEELVQRPLSTKKYKFEALQILPYLARGIVVNKNDQTILDFAKVLENLSNSCFKARGNYIKIVHKGEMEALAAAILLKSDAIIIDERTTRTLIESPEILSDILSKKLHTHITVNQDNLSLLKEKIGNLPVLRSFELATIAFELGLLDKYIVPEEKKIVPNLKEAVLEGVLWAVKLNGCSVKKDDIKEVIKLEKKN